MHYGAMNFPVLPVLAEIDAIAGMGFDYLELAMDAPMAHHSIIAADKTAIIHALKANGLGLVCHMPTFVSTADLTESLRLASVTEMRRSLEVAFELGATKIVLHPSMAAGLGPYVGDRIKAYAHDFLAEMVEAATGRDRGRIDAVARREGDWRVGRVGRRRAEAGAVHDYRKDRFGQAVFGHDRRHLLYLVHGTHKGQHHLQVGQPHFFAHLAYGMAFQRKAVAEAVGVIPRGTTEADHRVFLNRLKLPAANQLGILVRLEITGTQDHALGIKRRRQCGNAFGQFFDIKINRADIA